MLDRIHEDIDTVFERDPAVRSRIEVVLCYPGFHAVLFHRVARAAWQRDWFLVGRVVSQIGRMLTGIEIHPAACIGRRFFIDHGMGVVIGETSRIGDNVTLYHDVTLGGISPAENSHNQVNKKRHPTLGDNVIVGSGAQVLGPITVGAGARVGANSVVLKNVAPGATVVGIPAQPIMSRERHDAEHFDAYGTGSRDIQDPQARAIEGLLGQIHELSARVGQLEHQLKASGAPLAGRWPAEDEEDRPHE